MRRSAPADELPQSGAGKTIMTTEPKFVPGEAVEITLGENIKVAVRMVDCVGYSVPRRTGGMKRLMLPAMVADPLARRGDFFSKGSRDWPREKVIPRAFYYWPGW